MLGRPLIVIGKISNKLHFSALLSNTPFLSKSKSILPYSSKYIGKNSVCFFCKRPKENKSICSVHVFKCIRVALCYSKSSTVFVTVFSILLLIWLRGWKGLRIVKRVDILETLTWYVHLNLSMMLHFLT